MIKRLPALSWAAMGRIAVSAIVIAATPSVARAQSADLVLCDRLAADPSDPDKPADVKGTPDVAASDIATAIKFCKTPSGSSRPAPYPPGPAHPPNPQMPETIPPLP